MYKLEVKEDGERYNEARKTIQEQCTELGRAEELSTQQAALIIEMIEVKTEMVKQNQSLDKRLTTLQDIRESAKDKLMVSEQSAANLQW